MNTDLNISLKEDLLFKKIFSNQEALEDLINSFLEVMDIKERFYAIKCEVEASILPDKKGIKVYAGDVIATLNNWDIVNVEIYKNNFGRHEYKKTMCYLTRLYSNQMLSSDAKYENIHKVIGIVFMHGNFSKLNNDLINRYKFCKLPEVELIDEGDINCYLIRLDLTKEIGYTLGEKRFYKWLRFINATKMSELEEIVRGDKIMENSIRVVQEWYQETSRNALQDALKEERYYGERDGIKQKAIATAKKLLKRDMSIEEIADITELPKEEIISLIK